MTKALFQDLRHFEAVQRYLNGRVSDEQADCVYRIRF